MIQGVGQDGFAKAAIEAALRSVTQQRAKVDEQMGSGLEAASASSKPAGAANAFESALLQGLGKSDAAVRTTEQLPLDLLGGKVSDFHEVAGQLKQAEIVFKFSLEVRNKLIDAYREVMRMSV